jgi:hypothetical protein
VRSDHLFRGASGNVLAVNRQDDADDNEQPECDKCDSMHMRETRKSKQLFHRPVGHLTRRARLTSAECAFGAAKRAPISR